MRIFNSESRVTHLSLLVDFSNIFILFRYFYPKTSWFKVTSNQRRIRGGGLWDLAPPPPRPVKSIWILGYFQTPTGAKPPGQIPDYAHSFNIYRPIFSFRYYYCYYQIIYLILGF